MAEIRKTLIDAAWWAGGNRRRGIGQYLAYYFEYVCPIPAAERVFLLPATVQARDVADFLARFGGQAIQVETKAAVSQAWVESTVKKYSVSQVLLSSPFERPWSLLDFMPNLRKQEVMVEAIVFDLLPLEFPTEILGSWPAADQSQYRQRAEFLRDCDRYLAISPQTARSLEHRLSIDGEKIEVLKFGLTPAWLRPPAKGASVSRARADRKLALTITGGEWRKNLLGTLNYFAQHLLSDHDLFVICRLSLRESLRFRQRALQLDAYPAVRFLGEVSEREKWRRLYSADVFLFLSLAEGLGIPLLEARAAGIKRVLISTQLKDQGFDKLVPGCEVVSTTPTVRE